MSKIKHWDEQTQQWVIDGASNAANIELTNPGYLNEDGSSISVDLGFTKVLNRLFQAEKNIAWIYLNGAKGGGGGGGGTIDGTSYAIEIEEGTRVYTSSNSVTIHITITGGSVKKNFNVVIQDENGSTKGNYVVTSLTRTEIKISNLSGSANRLTINANSGLNYANPITLTVITGAIKIVQNNIPNAVIYPSDRIGNALFTVHNSTNSDLTINVLCNGEQLCTRQMEAAKESPLNLTEITTFLDSVKLTYIGETYTFELYAVGVLNDNILQSESIIFRCTIALPGTLYIITYGINKSVPLNNLDLLSLDKFVYGGSILFDYRLIYSDNLVSVYNIDYTVIPCYFVDGILIEDLNNSVISTSRGYSNLNLTFLFNTSSLPSDTIYDSELNSYKFVKVILHAQAAVNSSILDTKEVYLTLAPSSTKYITATNINSSLFAYFSPVMGIPTGNINTWTYNNKNTLFPYSNLGIVQQLYITLLGHNLAGFMQQNDMLGMHLLGKSWADLEISLFSSMANEVNLFNGSGWTVSFTFRTDSNVSPTSVVASIGKYKDDGTLLAGFEIQANKVLYAVRGNLYQLNISKGNLITIDIVCQRYVGVGDASNSPTHWFFKTYINGVLSLITSHTTSLIIDSENSGALGWYFNDFIHLGGRIINNDIEEACAVHVYDFKVYSTALSDNEIIQNRISALLYSLLNPGDLPDMTLQNELLLKNFILIGTDGNYHNILFDENDETEYKDGLSLLSSLKVALAESRIPYPIVVLNQTTLDPGFLGITESLFNENRKEEIMGYKVPVNMDYYTMGNINPVHIENNSSDGMKLGIQGTSSLRYNSKNYELYMGWDDVQNNNFLILMREDWLPENEYTLKADVMDSSHVNNILIGSIVNGLVTTSSGERIVPMESTPPMKKGDYIYANKVKHTSEGYPFILFINFRLGDNSLVCRCMGIYNFNLGRKAYYNLGLKLINNITYKSSDEVYPKVVESYTSSNYIEDGSPVFSMEVQENDRLGYFDLDNPDILLKGIFEFVYESTGKGSGITPLRLLLQFLASFGCNVETDLKVYNQGLWQTPKLDSEGKETGQYYPCADSLIYVQSTVDMHMNWNSMVSYYMIAIIFGLVDSMVKNLTLRSWTKSSDGYNVWYMCFYDMDTALHIDNTGAETVPYNAHLHRYYTDNTSIATAKVINHCSTMEGFINSYHGHNTRLQEIVENINPDSADAKTLLSFYVDLRTNLFPDPAEFIDTYYIGLINKVGEALYNYDYYLKYLLTKKTFDPRTDLQSLNTYEYDLISYLHGNGSATIKDWFIKRIRFLDGVYGVTTNGYNSMTSVNNTPLSKFWNDNNATFIQNLSLNNLLLVLSAESLMRFTIATAQLPMSFWIDELVKEYRIRNVTNYQVVTVYANEYLTSLGNFNNFTWANLNSLNFPLIKELSLRDQKSINSNGFLMNSGNNNLRSLVKLDLHGVTLLDINSLVVYTSLAVALLLDSLEELDISDSSFNEVPLSNNSVLKILNLSGTKIKSLSYSNLAMLEEINISNCNELQTITLVNCPKLKSLTVPGSVKTVILRDCPGIELLFADYNGSLLYTSNLIEVSVEECLGLKYVSFNNLNNLELAINLKGAPNLENVLLFNIKTTNIVFPAKNVWNSLKEINLSNSYISYINYYNTVPLITNYLDLEHFLNLLSLSLSLNRSIQGVKCANVLGHYINLTSSCLAECTGIRFLYGNFKITGTRVFLDCTSLTLNPARIYSSYDVTQFIDDSEACNIEFDSSLSSTDEMFNGCSSLSGNDFNMLMLKLHGNIMSLNKMFLNCTSIDATIGYDLFRHCPNVTNITSFAENTFIRGGIYSRSSNYNPSDDTTWGTFDFIPNLQQASSAFSGSGIQYIDNNVFAPLDGNYIDLREADYMFSNCYNLTSCLQVTTEGIIQNGRLLSKSFFTNLKNLGKFPKGMFVGCSKVDMDINTEIIDGVQFDYLYHWYPVIQNGGERVGIDIRTVDSTIYLGINLIGEIHDNVFGGRLSNDGNFYIARFAVINAPFENSGQNILCNLSNMGNMFANLRNTLLQARYVFRGVKFTNGSTIPNDIFAGCTKLNNIQGFFSNNTLNYNGATYEFPNANMFVDCTSLENVSYLFDNTYNLNIKLIGRGFINCNLKDVSGMMHNSGVFGMIPYQLFYMERNGLIHLSIDYITGVFSGCYKLGYEKERSIDIGTPYEKYNTQYYTTWDDAVIKVPGSRVLFKLDFNNFNWDDPWYIDGRDWLLMSGRDLSSNSVYLSLKNSVFKYDNDLAQTFLGSGILYNEPGYQNYMFPADYFRYCSSECTMELAFSGLTYYPNILVTNSEGINSLVPSDTPDGLVGRLPCKLFSANTLNTKFDRVFSDLNFCAFVNFNQDGLDPSNALDLIYRRGIKYPPDLLKNNTNLTAIPRLFQNTYIETGVDINSDLLLNNINLRDISGLFRDVLFSELSFVGGTGSNPQIDFNMFRNCGLLLNVSGLFAVSSIMDTQKGLRIIESRLFDPQNAEEVPNPHINNVSLMFANNKLLKGSIPIFDLGSFTFITNASGYVEGVNKGSITNAQQFMTAHSGTSWIPQTWIEQLNG